MDIKKTRLPALPRAVLRRGRQSGGNAANGNSAAVDATTSAAIAQLQSYWTLGDDGILHTNYGIAAAGNVAALAGAQPSADIPLAPGQKIVCGDAWLYFDPVADCWKTNKQIIVDND